MLAPRDLILSLRDLTLSLLRRGLKLFAGIAALVLFIAPLSALAAAEISARQWLERLTRADAGVAYRGLVVYERGDSIESLRVTHGSLDGRRYDHLEHLDGDLREVIRSGSSLTCIYPGQRLTRLLSNHQRAGADGVEADNVEADADSVEADSVEAGGIEDYYTLQLSGEGRIAGRQVVLLDVTPRDNFRLGYRFALDRETGLILRYEQVDAGQRVLERFQFASLEVSEDMPPAWYSAAAAAAAKPDSSDGDFEPLPARWQPVWLPPGFVPVTTGADDGDVQTYSDGMAMLSIFVEEATAAADNSGGSARRGATVAYTAQLLRGEQAFVVTVIGEVPPGTAQRVADAVSWQEGA